MCGKMVVITSYFKNDHYGSNWSIYIQYSATLLEKQSMASL